MTLTVLLALHQTHSQGEARVTRLLPWAAEATEQWFPGLSLSGCSSLSNTGKAVQLQFPHFCLQPTGREHLQLITMCFRIYAKTSFYHHIFCCGDFPHISPTASCQAGPSSLSYHMLESWFTTATQSVNA